MRRKKERIFVALVGWPLFAIHDDIEVRWKAQIILLDFGEVSGCCRAYQPGSEAPRQSGLAHTLGAGKQQRLRDASARRHFREGRHHSRVAEKVVQD